MMKRNEEKVPKFDEIIFENRNKEYGAYDLRKRYKSIASLSILGGLAIWITIFLVIALNSKTASADEGKKVIVIVQPENYQPPKVNQPEVKPPAELVKQPQNITPKVVDDSTVHNDFMPITDVLIATAVNGNPEDTLVASEPPVSIIPEEKKIFIVVEEPAEYPGGENALLNYIGKNIIYPEEAIKNNIEGRVILKFVITEDGSVGEVVLLKSVDPLLDKEAIRVIGTLPKFKPGKQGGTPVCVWYSVPVKFQLIR